MADAFGGWSGYNYVMGNPVTLVDPNGMTPKEYNVYVTTDADGNENFSEPEYISEDGGSGVDYINVIYNSKDENGNEVSEYDGTLVVPNTNSYDKKDASDRPGEWSIKGGQVEFEGIGPVDMLFGGGIFTRIAKAFGKKSVKKQGGEVLYEIGDGVRRAKASQLLGKKTIEASDHTGKVFSVPIKNLRSPMKSAIDVSTKLGKQRYDRVYKGILGNKKLPAIYVNKGSRGVKVSDITFKK